MDKVMQVLEGEVSLDSIKSSELYTKYVEPVVSSDLFKSNTGFTAGAEIINCRAAMVSTSSPPTFVPSVQNQLLVSSSRHTTKASPSTIIATPIVTTQRLILVSPL